MLILLSPAKTLNLDPQDRVKQHTTPEFLKQSRRLVKRLREFSVEELGGLMDISETLAEENHARFKQWRTPFTPDNAKQAVLTFEGDVYQGLQAGNWKAADLKFAQQHLRILSGLYGVLRPLDLMQPYRLEMGTSLTTDQGKDLYEFWGDTIRKAIDRALDEQGDRVLVNLASNEYFKAVRARDLDGRVITPEFKDEKGGKFRMLTFYGKRARGAMASYIVHNRLKDPDAIRACDVDGYRFNESLSEGDRWTFTRKQPPPKS